MNVNVKMNSYQLYQLNQEDMTTPGPHATAAEWFRFNREPMQTDYERLALQSTYTSADHFDSTPNVMEDMYLRTEDMDVDCQQNDFEMEVDWQQSDSMMDVDWQQSDFEMEVDSDEVEEEGEDMEVEVDWKQSDFEMEVDSDEEEIDWLL